MQKSVAMMVASSVAGIAGYAVLWVLQRLWPVASPDVTLLFWMVSLIASGGILVWAYLKIMSWMS